MAVLDQNRSAHAGFGRIGGAYNVVSALTSAVAGRRARAASRRSLQKLSDHQLDDIGLTRADVWRPFSRTGF